MRFNYKALWMKAYIKLKSVTWYPNTKNSHTVNIQKHSLLLRNFYISPSIRAYAKLKSLIQLFNNLLTMSCNCPMVSKIPFFYQLFNTIIRGAELLGENISPFEPFLKYRHASKIPCLEKEIHEMDLIPAHILLDARKLKQELQDFYQKLQPEDMRSKQASMLTNDAFRNTKLFQQMRLDDLGENSEMEEGFTYSLHEISAVKSQFYSGLEKSIGDLKRPLFQNEVPVVGVRCMGGDRNTTLALAPCNDHVKDLGGFPEDKKVSAGAMLQIWVYVRKLEWQDSFAILLILLELARSNLLNLTSNPRSAAAISYGNASELYFSRHDAMRDLALYLGGQSIAFQRNRVVMPRKENILPGKCELLKDRPFDAQIVSIHKDPMDKSEWNKNKFLKTEALMSLFAGSEYHLPSFIKPT